MPYNVYYTDYHWFCDNCLCRYCTASKCPMGFRPGVNDHDFCTRSRDRGACPRLDCDYFVNRKLRLRGFSVKRKQPSVWMLAERLYRIEKMLEQLLDQEED